MENVALEVEKEPMGVLVCRDIMGNQEALVSQVHLVQ